MKKNKINICMIALNYFPNFSGPDLQAHQVNKAVKRLGINVFVVTRNLGDKSKSYEKIDIIRLPRKKTLRIDSKMSLILWILSVLHFMIKNRSQYHIVHLISGYSYAALFAFVAGGFLKKEVIVKNSLARGAFYSNTLKKKINVTIFKKFAHAIAISTETEKELRKVNFKECKIAYIPNGIDLRRYHPVNLEEKKEIRRKLSLNEYNQYGIFVGFLNERKGTDLLAESVTYIVDKIQNFRLLLLGEFKELNFKNQIFKSIEKNKLKEYVHFLGTKSNISDYLKASDVFLFPTQREGLPNALLEAAAAGLPSICFSVGGVTDIIEHNFNGILIDNNSRSKKEFAESVVLLLQDKKKMQNLGKNALFSVKEKYDINKVASKYSDLYASLYRK